MNDIQIELKVNGENGILSIHGIDIFCLINTNRNWNNISSIEDPLLKRFFTYAKRLFLKDDIEDEDEGYDDSSMWSSDEEAFEYYERAFGSDGWDKAFDESERLENEAQCFANRIELSYDINADNDLTQICLRTPYNKIVWDESVYRYIYDNLDLWVCRIEEEIKIYNELGYIVEENDKIISVIRTAKSPRELTDMLMKKFAISVQTAETISNMILRELVIMTSEDCKEIVKNREEQKVVIDELITFKEKLSHRFQKSKK